MPRKIRMEGNESQKDKMFLTLVLDESGSMHDNKAATISSVNEYIDTLKRQDGDVRMSLLKFNTDGLGEPVFTFVFKGEKLVDIPSLDSSSYNPNNGTPLYDAIAEGIEETFKLASGDVHPKVLFVIMTDGEENQSKKYRGNPDAIKQMIAVKEDKDHGWTFVYLGANQDAWKAGQTFGIHSSNIASFTASAQGMVHTYSGLAHDTVAYMASDGAMGSVRGFTKSSYDVKDKDEDFRKAIKLPNGKSVAPQSKSQARRIKSQVEGKKNK